MVMLILVKEKAVNAIVAPELIFINSFVVQIVMQEIYVILTNAMIIVLAVSMVHLIIYLIIRYAIVRRSKLIL